MAANNYYGFPHAGAQYGYKLFSYQRMLETDTSSCSNRSRFLTRMSTGIFTGMFMEMVDR